eukprot:gene5272-3765_t
MLSSTPVQPATDPVAPFLRTTVFEKGALVNVLPRTWAGMNKIGGVGKVEHVRAMDAQEQPVDLAPLVAHGKHDDIACLRLYYKVKYVLDGHTDDDIPSAFVEKFEELSLTVSKPPASTKKLLTMKKPTKGGAASAVAASAAAAADDTADKLSGHKRGRNLVLLTTCIDETKQSLAMLPSSVTSFEQALAHFTATHREVSAVTHFTSSVTHVVVSVDKQGIMKQRTMKYMQALAHGVWVVSTKWIYACLQAGAIVDESEYEVKSNIKALIPRAPMRARQMRLSKAALLAMTSSNVGTSVDPDHDVVTNYEIQPFVAYAYKAASGGL